MGDNQRDTDMGDTAGSRATASHLVVFQHGLLGSELDLANMRALFDAHVGRHGVYAHVAVCNATSFTNMFATCDGIDCGAERLATEIVRVAAGMPQLQKFSLVGHSMGGLYARYCLGILYARGFFEHVEPMNFVTLATPHLGIRRPRRGSVNLLYNAIAPKLFDRTGRQFALMDEASDQTIALSKPAVGKYPHRASHAECRELDGDVAVCLDGKSLDELSPSDFASRRCELRDRVLSIYERARGPEATASERKSLAQLDLTTAEMALVLPESGNASSASSWDVVISVLDGTQTFRTACTLRLPHSELPSRWKWIPALSNASCNVWCCSQSAFSAPRPPPALLSCLARGQFLQALQLFRVRSLYATVFNDHTVPYSCGAVRAFNPYRHVADTAAALATSPDYNHIVQHTIAQAPKLRDTLPLDAKVSATRKSTVQYVQSKASSPSSNAISQPAPAPLSSLFSTGSDATASRDAPFHENHVLLDRVDAAFTTDDARDALRGMLVAMQSVGWRRLDVCIDSLLAHEMIIAKRAAIANAPSDWGLDIVHHVLDTFEL